MVVMELQPERTNMESPKDPRDTPREMTHSFPFRRDRSPYHPKDRHSDSPEEHHQIAYPEEGPILPQGWTHILHPILSLAPGEDANRAAGRAGSPAESGCPGLAGGSWVEVAGH